MPEKQEQPKYAAFVSNSHLHIVLPESYQGRDNFVWSFLYGHGITEDHAKIYYSEGDAIFNLSESEIEQHISVPEQVIFSEYDSLDALVRKMKPLMKIPKIESQSDSDLASKKVSVMALEMEKRARRRYN